MLPILLALVIIAIVFFVLLVGRPDEFKVVRSATMTASPATVFEQVNDFHKWDAWSPWAKIDPNCQITYTGPPAGVDANYAWVGNNKVGQGKMTIIASTPGSLIRLRLEFLKPFKATNTAEFKFAAEGGQTLVIWSMTGKNNFFFKVFGLFMDCDTMVGKDFEKGLASLKLVAEAPAKG